MLKLTKLKALVTTVTVVGMTATTNLVAMADGTVSINSPFKPDSSTVGKVTSNALADIVTAIGAIGAGIFLFNLYMAIMKFSTSSHNAQRREEARSHIIWALVSGVLLGGVTVFASAAFNWGKGL